MKFQPITFYCLFAHLLCAEILFNFIVKSDYWTWEITSEFEDGI